MAGKGEQKGEGLGGSSGGKRGSGEQLNMLKSCLSELLPDGQIPFTHSNPGLRSILPVHKYAENSESLSQVTKNITFSSFNFHGKKKGGVLKAWL